MSTPDPTLALSEQALLSRLLFDSSSANQVWASVSPTDFIHHQALAEVFSALRGEITDPTRIVAELTQRGIFVRERDNFEALVSGAGTSADVTYHAKRIQLASLRRKGWQHGQRLCQTLENPDVDPTDAVSRAILSLDDLRFQHLADDAAAGIMTVAELIAEGKPPPPWLIPNVLRAKERLLLTGKEGLGKSVLTRQIAVAAAAGVNPFNLRASGQPRRVLVIDCENSHEQSYDIWRRLVHFLYERGFKQNIDRHLSAEFITGGIDLVNPRDRATLAAKCQLMQPDLLVIGPLYQLHRGDPTSEENARTVKDALDEMRSMVGCAIVCETHSAHGVTGRDGNEARSLRPFGSSLWRRWPDFGKGLLQVIDEDLPDSPHAPRVCEFKSWRGDRRTDRSWPSRLVGHYDDRAASCWGWMEDGAWDYSAGDVVERYR